MKRPPRVLISAYGCRPHEGSESGAGWAMVEAAAVHHEVWVLTQEIEREKIQRRLDEIPDLAARIHPVHLGTRDSVDRLRRQNRDFYWHYPLWQWVAGRAARRLHHEVGLDVLHHVVFASDWQPVGLLAVPEIPLVWGPVGGATYPPPSLVAAYGSRSFSRSELIRLGVTTAYRRLVGRRIVERSTVRIALNGDTARAFGATEHVHIESNACVDFDGVPEHTQWFPPGGDGRHALLVGRQLAWKGCWLAIEALSRPAAEGWTLTVVGDGPDRAAAEARAVRLGVSDRVRFVGRRDRMEVLAALGHADALLFPSLHDSGSWAVAEAHDAGTPIICLDLGGPPTIMAERGVAVSPHGDVADSLSRALRYAPPRYPRSRRYSPERLPALLKGWYEEALAAKVG